MPNVGDIVQLTQCSNVLSQQACNVFYFTVAAWTGNLTVQEVLEAWRDTQWATIAGFTSTLLQGDQITWRNLDNTAESVSIDNDVDGLSSEQLMSPFVAVSARLLGETSETRSGWKRFPGITEGQVDNGTLTGTAQTNWQGFVDVLMADFVLPAGDGPFADSWLINIIVGRTPAGELDLSRAQPVVAGVLQPRITTQNTRKVGRGS